MLLWACLTKVDSTYIVLHCPCQGNAHVTEDTRQVFWLIHAYLWGNISQMSYCFKSTQIKILYIYIHATTSYWSLSGTYALSRTLQGNSRNIQHNMQYIVTTNLRTPQETAVSSLRESPFRRLHCLCTKHLGWQFCEVAQHLAPLLNANRIYMLLSMAQLCFVLHSLNCKHACNHHSTGH